ncbi:hypothetical protein DSL92_04550 [Billgrantia gudaonensis]|uniref:Uncharacterized protein n=1 Tax=Billgrantia gudaonensis TaxID=376427 RepID=A0A3S0R546_9GAMM|nr:hypothetical protein DSL92_04550 [Halomonas gudaonensis]
MGVDCKRWKIPEHCRCDRLGDEAGRPRCRGVLHQRSLRRVCIEIVQDIVAAAFGLLCRRSIWRRAARVQPAEVLRE